MLLVMKLDLRVMEGCGIFLDCFLVIFVFGMFIDWWFLLVGVEGGGGGVWFLGDWIDGKYVFFLIFGVLWV